MPDNRAESAQTRDLAKQIVVGALRENLRPIPQVAGGFKNTEAVMTEIVHEEVNLDREQGGFTEGTGAVERVFILWAIIVFRWIVLSEATYAVFMDLASFSTPYLPSWWRSTRGGWDYKNWCVSTLPKCTNTQKYWYVRQPEQLLRW